MHFSTPVYLLSLFAIPLLASPTPEPTTPTNNDSGASSQGCRRGIYNSVDLCTEHCGSGPTAGNCSRITTTLIHDADPYDCTCPGDSTPDIIEVPAFSQSPSPSPSPAPSSSSQSSSGSETQPTPKLRARSLVDDIAEQMRSVKTKAKVLKEMHREDIFTEKEPEPPAELFALPQQMPVCKRGYYPSMDRCMANCGMRSGRCVGVGESGVGVVACMCSSGEL